MSLKDKLVKLVQRHEEISTNLAEAAGRSDFARLSKEHSDLSDIAEIAKPYLHRLDEMQELEAMLKDITEPELQKMAQEEKINLSKTLQAMEDEIRIALLPKDVDDEKGAILEIRAGTGGEEAALFAAVLFRMYKRYSEKNGWKFEVLTASETGLDGFKEVSACISGKAVFAHLKFESGVHRVQRVPETESSGRIHTSAATVAVLPEVEEVDLSIRDEDLKIDVYRASGAGGQHVNTTDSAVRITHLPSGIVVCQQDEKSQHKNKAKALKILRSRLYDSRRTALEEERSSMRRGQIGSGDRSERIRTYNYPQSRVTDHRINITCHNLPEVVEQGEIDQFVKALVAEHQAMLLADSSGLN